MLARMGLIHDSLSKMHSLEQLEIGGGVDSLGSKLDQISIKNLSQDFVAYTGELNHLKQLEVLTIGITDEKCEIQSLPLLRKLKIIVDGKGTISKGLLESPNLEYISITATNALIGIEQLHCPKVSEVDINRGNLDSSLPALSAPKLKKITLTGFNARSNWKCLNDTPNLKFLSIETNEKRSEADNHIQNPDLFENLGKWPLLEEVSLEGNIHFKLDALNSQLQLLTISDNDQIRHLEFPKMASLKYVHLDHLNTELIRINQTLPNLSHFRFEALKNLKQITIGPNTLPKLECVSFYHCSDLLNAPTEFIYTNDYYTEYIPQSVDCYTRSPNVLTDYYQNHQYSKGELKAIKYWSYKLYEKDVPSTPCLETSIRLLHAPVIDALFGLMLGHLHRFNTDKKVFMERTPSELSGRNLFAAGKPEGSIQFINRFTNAFNLKVVSKIEEAQLILYCPDNTTSLTQAVRSNNATLFSEYDLYQFYSKYTSEFKGDDTVFTSNIQAMLCSSDSGAQLKAMKIMESDGLPKSLEAHCILIAIYQNNEFRDFLAGKISRESRHFLNYIDTQSWEFIGDPSDCYWYDEIILGYAPELQHQLNQACKELGIDPSDRSDAEELDAYWS